MAVQLSVEIRYVANLLQCRNDAVTPVIRPSTTSQRMHTPTPLQESINDMRPNETVGTGDDGRLHRRILLSKLSPPHKLQPNTRVTVIQLGPDHVFRFRLVLPHSFSFRRRNSRMPMCLCES